MYASALSRNHVKVTALAALLSLAACATQKSALLPPLDSWETRQQVLGNVRDWSFSGRIAVSDGVDGFNGNLRWRQNRQHFEARVSGPFGAGSVQIKGNAQRVTVTEKDGTVTELRDAERDLRDRYGWSIPVTSLRYWALGIPDPSRPADTEFGDDGQLRRMQQGGWAVDIGQYREGGGQAMPRRITAVNADARVRLVIDRWIFH
jgi:outer membrane lipoprotein LolB